MVKNLLKNALSRILPTEATRRRKQSSYQQCSAEVLEDKTLLAGNVLASMSGSGNLTIKGDNFNNNINVVAIANGVRVVGLQDLNGSPTTVNGLPFVDFSVGTVVPGNLKAIMKGGHDRVGLLVAVNGNVTANMGSGSDFVEAVSSVIGGNVKVNMGSSTNLFADGVTVANVAVGGNAVIKGGKGSHIVGIANSSVAKTLSVSLGGGDDTLIIGNSFATGFKANGGSGVDIFEVPGPNPPVKNFEIII